MANYKESAISGDSYVRANRIIVENPKDGTPSINYIEEQVINLGAETITRPLGALSLAFADPDATFTLLNPVDGSALGTATHGQLQAMLFSLYFDLATKRDTNTGDLQA